MSFLAALGMTTGSNDHVTRDEIIKRAYQVFEADVEGVPPITLRGGDALDGYDEPPPYDSAIDEPSDRYLETFAFTGLNFLDAVSWRHYLPRLIDYALRRLANNTSGTMAVDGLLWSLRPPDRDPSRLASLTREQEEVVVAALEQLAFSDDSIYRTDARQVMEEWWMPGALYRPPREPLR
ncbi:MAG TPA: DUF6714 family protein [Gemmatimonadaceae bacterium]|nr:DUF6714 family protein [Gemmatimonadaceae bacterium]